MQTCHKFREWAEHSMRLSLAKIPDEIAKHAEECPRCAKELQFLQSYAQKAIVEVPNDGEMENLWNNIEKSIWQDRKASGKASVSFMENKSPWQKLLNLLPEWNQKVVIAVFAVIFMVFIRAFFSDDLPHGYGKISGAAGELFHSGKSVALSLSDDEWNLQDHIVLSDSLAWAEISYATGRKIRIEGRGRLQLTQDGFATEQGQFKASFAAWKGISRVAVPGANLIITGTAIQFDLHAGKGAIKLLEGVVEVAPTDGRKPFIWKQDTELKINADKLLQQVENDPEMGVSSDTGDLRQRSSEY